MGSNGSKVSRPAADDAEGSRPLRKSPHSFLVPLFSSLSCGTSSSWRKDSFMQERLITHGDHVAGQISLEKPVAYGQQSLLPPQSLGGTFRRDISDDHSVTGISSASVQSLCGSVESTDTTLFNGCSSNVVDDANSSLFGWRCMSDRQAANMSWSQTSLDTQSSNRECLSINYDSHEEYSSNQTILGACNVANVSRVDDASDLMFKQESLANRTDLRWPQALSCDGSSMAMDQSSSHDTVNADQFENHGVPQYDVAGLVEAVDDFSISRPESSGREARRNNGRRLWDALNRAASRRRIFSSAHTQPDEDANSSRNVNDDWGLLDWNSHELTNISARESGSVSRSSMMEERRWRTRPQSWALQHSTDSVGGRFGHSRHCALNRHANGNCSCEAFAMTDESSTRASISRIVMLAEALFEVLDEIHRQSVTLSRSTSLSLVSMPAPEEVVNSLASRVHKKSDPSVSLPGQCAECYICLIEYEEGDYIRVLPCSHVFHMLCVDRWLKEAHRVCPLCRHNVCEESMRS